jgi:hypothetical protein
MSEIGFKYYKVPDAIDNVCDLANEMIHTRNIKRILKDIYPDFVLEGYLFRMFLNCLKK